MKRAGHWLLLGLLLLAAACSKDEPKRSEVMLAAAASLRTVTPELVRAYEAQHPAIKVAVTYGASGDLKKQVEGGAPIDGVLFAAAKPVDELIGGKLASADARRVIATNKLVLIGPKNATPVTFATIDSVAKGEHIAIGDPGAVPAGQYARDALKKLGKWDAIQDRLVLGGDVAAVLAYARRGEVAAAIVYGTETIGIDDIVVFEEAKGDFAPHPEVVATTIPSGVAAAEAGRFIDFVVSAEGQKILEKFGFGAP